MILRSKIRDIKMEKEGRKVEKSRVTKKIY